MLFGGSTMYGQLSVVCVVVYALPLVLQPREPKVDLPVVFRTMREGAKNLRAGKGLGALSGNPLGEYEYLLDKCGLPADFFADPVSGMQRGREPRR